MTRTWPSAGSTHGKYSSHGYLTARPLVLFLAKAFFLALPQHAAALPVPWVLTAIAAEDEKLPLDSRNPTLWIYMIVAVALVLLGGAFAGLTIALMGQVSDKLLSVAYHDTMLTCFLG